jgi:hypothetical protein
MMEKKLTSSLKVAKNNIFKGIKCMRNLQKSKRKNSKKRGINGGFLNITKLPPINKKTKKCTPYSKKNKTTFKSCITKSILKRIKEKYNIKFPKNQITSNDPIEIWKTLNERVHCNSKEKDDCFLDLLDENEKKIIRQKIFSPEAPEDWKQDPNTWLSNFDIEAIMEDYEEAYPEFHYIATPPIDFAKKIPFKCVEPKLCNISLQKEMKQGKTKLGIIFNLDVHTGSGTHWTSFFCDLVAKNIFYFDSAGNGTPPEIDDFIKKLVKQGKKMGIHFAVHTNGEHTHQKSNTECGMYSLFFVITQLTGEIEYLDTDGNIAKKILTPKEKIELFTKEIIPDSYVEKYRKLYFN